MRAVQITEFGGPEVLVPVELPDPVAGPGQVLVEVAAAGVNRADALLRAGRYHRAGRPPLVPGVEAAGTVRAVGAGVTGIAAGQRVLAMGEAGAPGLYAELAAVPAEQVVVLPEGIEPAAAAALPSAWFSAWYSLRHLARAGAGETVAVHAAASGVGSAAVQIAAAAGARVIALAGTPTKTDWVTALGAHDTVDTVAHPGDAAVQEVLRLTGGRGAEVVLDLVGGPAFGQSLRMAAAGGRVVAMANVALAPSTIDTRDFYPKNVTIHGFQVTNLLELGFDPRPDLLELAEQVAAGRLRVPVESRFPLERAADAHRQLERRGNRGKVVLTVDRPH
ncbi:quinone oxidoreductase family protein [Kitasatospora sp. LaBMicrA B282]|uniref:quinone oxidoreductase family protein n=1 Tax=Kitasatospora sp. LaBMicrA B282 TaxID=3420949 RepID=UPI003D0CB727